jgi:hypothetical protein
MLDQLPLELLDHILDLLPSPSTADGARERTDTLIVCCFVSKRVYERTLPVLWRDIRLESEEQVRMMVTVVEQGVAAELRSSTKAFTVAGDPYSGFPISLRGPLPLVALFPAIKRLELISGSEGAVDFKLLATGLPGGSTVFSHSSPQAELLSLADLEFLHLASTITSSFPAQTTFPSLRSLGLHEVKPDLDSLQSLLQLPNFPKLKFLAYTPKNDDRTAPSVLKWIENDLMQQLDGLQLHVENFNYFTTSTLRLPVPTVFTADEFDLEDGVSLPSAGPEHVRFWIRGGDVRDICPWHVANLLEVVNVVPPPRSLHLPTILRNGWRTFNGVASSLDGVLSTCHSRQTEVLWYDPDQEDNYAVSPSFWRYAKRFKVEQAAATATVIDEA